MTDNITLPREVVQEALEALAKTPCNSVYEQDCTPCNAEEALRKALAAEQPKHPGYVIGSHWLETAYSRICAGEAEADVLRDIGLVRITDGMVETADIHAIVDRQEAMRRDAFRKGFYAGFAATAEGWNGEYPFQDKNKPIVGDPSVEAAIDAAMEGKR